LRTPSQLVTRSRSRSCIEYVSGSLLRSQCRFAATAVLRLRWAASSPRRLEIASQKTNEPARELRGRRVGAVLSAGYFGFFGHAGFVAALWSAGVERVAWAGTSAGALVAALAASGLEPPEIAERLLRLRRNDFWDPTPIRWLGEAVRGRIPTGILAGR